MNNTAKTNISIIVVIAKNNAIGKDNKLLCYLPEDLKRFKKITSGHNVIMGLNTWHSLPKKPLPNRTNIVLAKKDEYNSDECTIVHSIDEALQYCKNDDEVFVIGGESIYKQMLPFASKLYITLIHKEFEADTFFPEIEKEIWQLVSREDHYSTEENGISFSYLNFERI